MTRNRTNWLLLAVPGILLARNSGGMTRRPTVTPGCAAAGSAAALLSMKGGAGCGNGKAALVCLGFSGEKEGELSPYYDEWDRIEQMSRG